MKVNLYGIFRVQNDGPLPKVGGHVRPNTSNMPKAGPGEMSYLTSNDLKADPLTSRFSGLRDCWIEHWIRKNEKG